jgi:hypothetical protein
LHESLPTLRTGGLHKPGRRLGLFGGAKGGIITRERAPQTEAH